MDARLTDEQRMLRDLAGHLAADLAPSGVAALTPDARAAADPAGWAALAEAGLIAPHAQPDGGGSVMDAALVAERLAGSLVGLPYVGTALWAPTLLAAAGARDVLDAVASGSLRLAPVLRPDLGGLAQHGERGIAFDAQGADAGLVLDAGRLRVVALAGPAPAADLTRSLRQVSAAAASAGEPGPHGASDAQSVALDSGTGIGAGAGVEVEVGDLGGILSAEALARAEAVILAVLAADLLGVMQTALDDAVAHVGVRRQFGVPIGSFQAVQHLAAQAAMLVEGARSSTWHAAWAAGALPAADALLAARQAKAYCASAAREVGETAIQLLGGIGLTHEHLAHVRLRRILLSRAVLGDETAQYAAIADTRLAPDAPVSDAPTSDAPMPGSTLPAATAPDVTRSVSGGSRPLPDGPPTAADHTPLAPAGNH
ncbi:Acyl-CoA dehydrogenase [Frankia sp. AiPs1]|uniref:acyl-CoA dehydrogenase n=1 Tax=Frankia sp. AiPa1 TaxID=573492 RepID=UPI00202B31B2|nr:acyl-CoA dehydrogenase [Frankia sp. AiPa1]MCL9762721.1 acyl-CoA dehydrogenase family protein [Frankia sp. AiPa1]